MLWLGFHCLKLIWPRALLAGGGIVALGTLIILVWQTNILRDQSVRSLSTAI